MKYFITIILTNLILVSFAQKKQNIYYLNAKDQIVKEKESAAYYSIIQEPDSLHNLFPYFEYYKDNTKKKIAHITSFQPFIKYEGQAISFYPNGARKFIGSFHSGYLLNGVFYYPNGNVKRVEKNDFINYKHKLKLIQIGNENGKQYLDEFGTGKVQVLDKNSNIEIINYKKGLKDGEAKLIDSIGNIIYIEQYKNGKLINGKFYEGNDIIEYTEVCILPAVKGGEKELHKHLNKNLSSKTNQILSTNYLLGIILKFNVGSDGSTSNFRILKSISSEVDEEIINLLKNCCRWIPGKVRGVSVLQDFQLILAFKNGKISTNLINAYAEKPYSTLLNNF